MATINLNLIPADETQLVLSSVAASSAGLMTTDGSNSALALGSAGTPSLKFAGDANTGIYSPGADQLSVTTGGTERLRIDSTGQIEAVSLGSAAAPTFSFTGDPNTGVYSPGADQLAASTAGVERLRITSAGNVGIGTTSPDSALEVNGAVTSKIGSTADASLAVMNTIASTFLLQQSDKFQIYTGAGQPIVFTNSNTERARIDSSGGFRVRGAGAAGSTDAFFINGSAPASSLQLDSSGRLLVGTSSNFTSVDQVPRLFVATTDNVSGVIGVGQFASTNYGAYFDLIRSDSGVTGQASSGAVPNGGTIGALRFNGSDGTTFRTGATILASPDGQTWASEDCPTRLVFSTTADGAPGPTERMRISNNGYSKHANTGSSAYDNTTGSYHELVSDGADNAVRIKNTNATPYGLRITHTTDSNAAGNEFLACFGAVTLRAALRSNGGLANYSANDANLSDRNAKKDISIAAGTWDCIKDWEIVNYRYKDQPDDADLNLGVIAQQVAESCPEVVTIFQEAKEATEDQPAQEERLGVKEQQMYWMAIKALQEAMERIESLEAKVAALEAQ